MKLEVIHRSKIYAGRIIAVVVDRLRRDDGVEMVREVVRHPGGVVVIAEVSNEILFVRQRRYPMNTDLLELPAGKLDGGEDPAAAARRELEEETGFRAGLLSKVGEFFSAPGYCDELLHVYLAEQVTASNQKLDSEEDIQVERYSLEQALKLIASGGIRDTKTALGVLWLATVRSGRLTSAKGEKDKEPR